MPMIAAGGGAPASSSSSSRNNAVGALPMATSAPASRSPHRSSAAAERVVPSARRESQAHPARPSVQTTSLPAGKRGAGDAVGDHLGIAQDRPAGEQCAARRRRETVAEAQVTGDLDHAAGVDHPDRNARFLRRQAGQVGFGADGGERSGVDRRAVALVVVARGHAAMPRSRIGGLGHGHAAPGRGIGRATAKDDVVTARFANQRDVRRRRMSAALGTARDVQRAGRAQVRQAASRRLGSATVALVQAGWPGQANIRTRGSVGVAIRPSAALASRKASGSVTPGIASTRHGVTRSVPSPNRSDRSAKRRQRGRIRDAERQADTERATVRRPIQAASRRRWAVATGRARARQPGHACGVASQPDNR